MVEFAEVPSPGFAGIGGSYMASQSDSPRKISGLPPQDSRQGQTAFSEALSKLVSVSHAEMQKRIKTVPEVPISRHRRYKYVPAKPPQKP